MKWRILFKSHGKTRTVEADDWTPIKPGFAAFYNQPGDLSTRDGLLWVNLDEVLEIQRLAVDP